MPAWVPLPERGVADVAAQDWKIDRWQHTVRTGHLHASQADSDRWQRPRGPENETGGRRLGAYQGI